MELIIYIDTMYHKCKCIPLLTLSNWRSWRFCCRLPLHCIFSSLLFTTSLRLAHYDADIITLKSAFTMCQAERILSQGMCTRKWPLLKLAHWPLLKLAHCDADLDFWPFVSIQNVPIFTKAGECYRFFFPFFFFWKIFQSEDRNRGRIFSMIWKDHGQSLNLNYIFSCHFTREKQSLNS
jgi:hypothetical protein